MQFCERNRKKSLLTAEMGMQFCVTGIIIRYEKWKWVCGSGRVTGIIIIDSVNVY